MSELFIAYGILLVTVGFFTASIGTIVNALVSWFRV